MKDSLQDSVESPEPAIRERTSRRRQRMAQVLRQRQDDLTLVLANIHDPHNVSAIYRSCDAFGVSKVHLYYTRTPFPVLGRKSSASARKWVESERARTEDDLAARLKGWQILATSFSDHARPLRAWNFLQPTAIILGNEHSGVDAELLAMADGELYIPMRGMIQSLNVSVAAAVILAEAARQREEAGFYDRLRMSQEEYDARLAEWLEK